MSDTNLKTEIDARGVAFVILNRPEVHNAFDPILISDITQQFLELGQNPAVKLAVIAGEGKSFCAGGDLNWMRSMKEFTREQNIADAERLAEMYLTLAQFPKPLIAVVHGAALGGGSGLAAVADYVLAADNSKFGFTETRLGILPAVIAPYALAKIGRSAAHAYFLSGMQFTAHTAKEIGLVHRVVELAELELARNATIVEFLKAAPGASANAKALLANIIAHESDPAMVTKLTTEAIADARVSEEGQAGMDALLNSRIAPWVTHD